jgi:hypothetical protein
VPNFPALGDLFLRSPTSVLICDNLSSRRANVPRLSALHDRCLPAHSPAASRASSERYLAESLEFSPPEADQCGEMGRDKHSF